MGCLIWGIAIPVAALLLPIPTIGPGLSIALLVVAGWLHYQGSKVTEAGIDANQVNTPASVSPSVTVALARPNTTLITGTQYYSGWGTTRGTHAVDLVREPHNPYDANAVAVYLGGQQIGHLPRQHARTAAPMIDLEGGQIRVDGHFGDNWASVSLPSLPKRSLAPKKPVRRDSFIPWGKPTQEFEVAYESEHRREIAAVFRSIGVTIPGEGISTGKVEGHLVSSDHPAAPAVIVNGQWVGNLVDPAAEPYALLVNELYERGQRLEVAAKVWALDDRGTTRANVRIRLPRPEEIDPPGPMPSGRHVLLPRGVKVQVTGEDKHMDQLGALLDGEPEVSVVITLHCAQPSTGKRRVEVRAYGETVGYLTPYMSEHFLPLVDACDEEGVTVACHGLVQGNQIKADVLLDTRRAGDLSDDWIAKHVYELREDLDE